VKHPLYDWLKQLKTVKYGKTVAWVSPDDEYEERPDVDCEPIDEIRVRRTLLRPSRKELQYVARKLEEPEALPGCGRDDRPSIAQVRTAWLEPQAAALRGIRLQLLPRRTLLEVSFYL
jgi:hypothetical protein